MKKVAMGFVAIVFAVASVAFTTASHANKFDCSSSNLIWFKALVGQGDDLASLVSVGSPISSVELASLDQDDYSDVSPLNSVTSADFTSRLKTQSQAETAFCPTSGQYVCAIAFAVDNTPDGEFELKTIGTTKYIVPKTNPSGTRPVVECIIFRPTE